MSHHVGDHLFAAAPGRPRRSPSWTMTRLLPLAFVLAVGTLLVVGGVGVVRLRSLTGEQARAQVAAQDQWVAAQNAILRDPGSSDPVTLRNRLNGTHQEQIGLLQARLSASAAAARDTEQVILAASLLGALVVCAAGARVSWVVLCPVSHLGKVADQIGSGDFSGQAPVEGPPELARMATAVNASLSAVARARADARSVTQARSAFLATVSHDIRAPMNAVIGMTGLLLDTPLDAEQRDLTQAVRDSGEALLTVINDILDFSRFEAGDLDLEAQPFELRDCVESAAAQVAQAVDAEAVELVVQIEENCPSVVIGDVTRFRQIVVGLLSNAAQATESGEIVVTVDAPDRSHAGAEPVTLTVSVRDTGVGIAVERIPQLFRSFSQVDATAAGSPVGAGLGLAIGRLLAAAMGGGIEVRSAVGVGSTFTATVVLLESPDRRHPVPAFAESLTDRSALIVDDSATSRRVLQLLLAQWGMEGSSTATPADALALLAGGSRFDVGILDLLMPDMDGRQLARTIRTLPAGRELPLILLGSSRSSEPDPQDAHVFSAIVTKPVTSRVLFSKLLQVLAPAEAILSGIEDAGGGRAADPPPLALDPLRVLLAEGNPVNQHVVQLMLTKLGHRVDTAADTADVIEALRRIRYDIIFLDVQLPGLAGRSVTELIRAEIPTHRPVPIVGMTAEAGTKHRQARPDPGMTAFLSKPIRIHDLAEALFQALPEARVPERVRTWAQAEAPGPADPN
jgi:signal transduction histidine kinase/DNA-binding response OmpR family regulator